MSELKKHALLLSVLGILLFAKFAIVPLFEWQQLIITDIAHQQKKLSKTTKILSSEDDSTQKNAQLISELEKIQKLFFEYQVESDFKLSQQQNFEALFEKHQVSTNNIGWQTTTNIQATNLIRYQVDIRFDGTLVNIIALFLELESASPWLQISEFNLSTSGTSAEYLGYNKGGRVSINIYMQKESTAAVRSEV